MENKYIVLDTETTGLNAAEDELLQVSIIDNEGAVLFDSYIRPTQHTEWAEAERIHHITPEMVADAPTIAEVMPEINDILNRYDKIVGYNLKFDKAFLENNGAEFLNTEYTEYADVVKMFAPIYGEWNDQRGSYKWQKLTIAADYYGYDWSEHKEAHNSLGDCYATLYVYKKLTTDTMTIERVIDGKRVGIELTPAEISQAYYIKESDDRRQDILNALDEMNSLKIGNIDLSKDFLKNSTTFIDDVIYRYEKMDDHLEDYNMAIEDVVDNAADNYVDKLVSNYVQNMSLSDKEQFIESAEMAMDRNDTNEPAFSKIEHMVYKKLIDERRTEHTREVSSENYKIYQLKDGEKYHGIRFEPYHMIEAIGINLNKTDYDLVYEGKISEIKGNSIDEKLENIYSKFNRYETMPETFMGHSLSISDVVEIGETAYYVDDIGFKKLSPFLDNEEEEQNEVLDLTSKSGRSL